MKSTHNFTRYTLLLSIIIILFLSASLSYGITFDRVLATVGEEVITFADYQLFIKSIGNGEKSNSIDEDFLKKMIEEKVILLEAKRKGIDAGDEEVDKKIQEFQGQHGFTQEAFEAVLKEEGLNTHTYRKLVKDGIISSKLINEDIDTKIFVDDKEILNFYHANKRDFLSNPEKVELKAIFLRMKEDASVTEITDLKLRALKIAGQVKQGETFDIFVDQFSDEPLKSQEGKLGNFAKGALIGPLDIRAFSMKVGEISDPV